MNYIRILLIVVLIVQTKCFDSDDEIIEKELELLKKGEEDVSIRGYCDHEYKQPMKGASEWQKPTVPLLLVPGIGGTMLHGNEPTPKKLWLSYRYINNYGIEYLSTNFDSSTGNIKSRFCYDNYVTFREDFHGLCPIDNLDPDLIIRPSIPKYYNTMINWATSLGYEPGTTLFGFPYDWRHSIRYKPTLDRLKKKIIEISKSSPNQKVDIISHSMGGLLFKIFLGQYPDMHNYIRNWIPIGTPWIGAAGLGYKAMISGYNMDIITIPGIGGLTEKVANQLELGWPSAFELLPNLKDYEKEWGNSNPYIIYTLNNKTFNATSEEDILYVLEKCNVNNTFDRLDPKESYPQPFDYELWNYSQKTREILKKSGDIIKKSVNNKRLNIYNIIGESVETKFALVYEEEIKNMTELKEKKPTYIEVYGDGTVPARSALTDGMNASTYLYIGEQRHQKLLESKEILNAIRYFVGLQCSMEGEWNITVWDEPSLPNSSILRLNHTTSVFAPRKYLFSDEQITFINFNSFQGVAKLSEDCLSFEGDIGIGTWKGERIIGDECSPGSRIEKKIKNGLNVTLCYYGYWSTKTLIECDEGYFASEGNCKSLKSLPSTLIVVIIISVSVVVALTVLGIIFFISRKKKDEYSYTPMIN